MPSCFGSGWRPSPPRPNLRPGPNSWARERSSRPPVRGGRASSTKSLKPRREPTAPELLHRFVGGCGAPSKVGGVWAPWPRQLNLWPRPIARSSAGLARASRWILDLSSSGCTPPIGPGPDPHGRRSALSQGPPDSGRARSARGNNPSGGAALVVLEFHTGPGDPPRVGWTSGVLPCPAKVAASDRHAGLRDHAGVRLVFGSRLGPRRQFFRY